MFSLQLYIIVNSTYSLNNNYTIFRNISTIIVKQKVISAMIASKDLTMNTIELSKVIG